MAKQWASVEERRTYYRKYRLTYDRNAPRRKPRLPPTGPYGISPEFKLFASVRFT